MNRKESKRERETERQGERERERERIALLQLRCEEIGLFFRGKIKLRALTKGNSNFHQTRIPSLDF